MPIFRIVFVSNETGERNARTIESLEEEGAIAQLGGVSVVSVERLSHVGATQSQLKYLSSLGVVTFDGLSKSAASDLIGNALHSRVVGGERELDIAMYFDVSVTQCVSRRSIFSGIFRSLLHREAWNEMTIWFVWRVHRHLQYHGGEGGADMPFDPRILAVCNQLMLDGGWLSDLQRVSRNAVCEFRWFGVYKENQGESMRTRAFQKARRALTDAGLGDVVRESSVAYSQYNEFHKKLENEYDDNITKLNIDEYHCSKNSYLSYFNIKLIAFFVCSLIFIASFLFLK